MTSLYKSIECENLDIVKILLSNDEIDVNIPFIFKQNLFYDI